MDTGEFMTRREYLASPFSPKIERQVKDTTYTFPAFSPNGPWAIVSGQCIFPIEASRTIDGPQTKLGSASNSEPTSEFISEVVGEYQTQGFKWNMTYEERVLDEPEVLELFKHVPVALNFRWAVDPFLAEIKGRPTVIPPCTDIIMNFTSWLEYVTLSPVFHVDEYRMDMSGHMNEWKYDSIVVVYDSWRNWGEEWMDIFDEKFEINGMAERLTDGPESTVEGVVVYDFESQPQCP